MHLSLGDENLGKEILETVQNLNILISEKEEKRRSSTKFEMKNAKMVLSASEKQ